MADMLSFAWLTVTRHKSTRTSLREGAEMKPMHRWLCVLGSLLVLAGGCARRAQQTTGPSNTPRQDDLPSWAPEHPSPEFLRAAKLLKAVPTEAEPYSPEFVPCWELFGSLTDQQIAELLTWQYQSRSARGASKEMVEMMVKSGEGRVEGDRVVFAMRWVRVPIESFSPRQRQLLDKYAAAYGETDRGPRKHDLLVDLYHAGAEQDLSNVDLFISGQGHLVTLSFGGHGKPFPFIGTYSFAQLRESPPFAQFREPAAPQLREKPRAETGRAR